MFINRFTGINVEEILNVLRKKSLYHKDVQVSGLLVSCVKEGSEFE